MNIETNLINIATEAAARLFSIREVLNNKEFSAENKIVGVQFILDNNDWGLKK